MINFIKKVIVRFLTRKVFVVSNKATLESFIVSHITDDGYVSLLTDSGSYLPVSYSVFKKMFQQVHSINEQSVVGVSYKQILLSSGESVVLTDINEPSIEDSFDSDYL
jgi:hypothetical protein